MIKSKVIGGFCGDVIVLHCVGKAIPHDQILKLRKATTHKFEVLCHNHLLPHNDIINETTLKVNAIIDWDTLNLRGEGFEGRAADDLFDDTRVHKFTWWSSRWKQNLADVEEKNEPEDSNPGRYLQKGKKTEVLDGSDLGETNHLQG